MLLLCVRLPEDTLSLRTVGKQAGFQCYCGSLLRGSTGPIGVLGLAFRTMPDLSRLSCVMTAAASLLGLRISEVFATWRQRGMESVLLPALCGDHSRAQPFEMFLREVARQLNLRQSELYFRSEFPLPRFSALPYRSVPACPTVGRGDFDRCPACNTKQSVLVPSAVAQRLTPCRAAESCEGYCCCVPLVVAGKPVGVLRSIFSAQSTDSLLESIGLAELASSALTDALALLDSENLRLDRQRTDTPSSRLLAGPRIAIRCFGTFEITIDGRTIDPTTIPRRRVLQLLKILAVNHKCFVPRDMLMEWLWPDSDVGNRITQFYVIVHELRRLLDPGNDPRQSRTIVRDGERYRLVLSDSVWLDIAEFEQAVERGKQAEAAGDSLAAVNAYSRAAELYRGDLLQDEPYAEWCWDAREQLRESCLFALQRLAFFWSRDNRWDASVSALRRALELDNLRENLHRDLMYALWALGRRADAVRQFAECARLLREHLNLEPSKETLQLLETIRKSAYPG